MIKELKTLKDLKSIATYDRNFVCKQELKAEVVKWVKEFEERDDDENKQSWIKHFFNLTEEDLNG